MNQNIDLEALASMIVLRAVTRAFHCSPMNPETEREIMLYRDHRDRGHHNYKGFTKLGAKGGIVIASANQRPVVFKTGKGDYREGKTPDEGILRDRREGKEIRIRARGTILEIIAPEGDGIEILGCGIERNEQTFEGDGTVGSAVAPFIVACNGAFIHISKGATMTFRVFMSNEELTERIDERISEFVFSKC